MKIDIVRIIALGLACWLFNQLPVGETVKTVVDVAVIIVLVIALVAGWL